MAQPNIHQALLTPKVVDLDHCLPDPREMRRHPASNIDRIAGSLATYGQRTPIVINTQQNNRILKGNGTWMAARQLGWDSVVVVEVDDEAAVALGYTLADNESGQDSDWDMAAVQRAISEDGVVIEEVPAIDTDFIKAILAEARREFDLVPDPESYAYDDDGGEPPYPIPDVERELPDIPDRVGPYKGVFPLAIVLTAADVKQWNEVKHQVGVLDDTKVFLHILAKYRNGD